jgi:hypothetical protein
LQDEWTVERHGPSKSRRELQDQDGNISYCYCSVVDLDLFVEEENELNWTVLLSCPVTILSREPDGLEAGWRLEISRQMFYAR